MKVLYAIQGTGNGHLSRAADIIPLLQQRVDLDVLVSGTQADVSLACEVKYHMKGWSFIFGKKGGVDLWGTYKKTDTRRIWREIRALPVADYDLVINDFEPISTWAARLKSVPCIALSHQAAVLNKNAPKPDKSDWLGKGVLRHYAPARHSYGFHFERYDENIYTPIIRERIRNQEIKNLGHYTVYLPAYGDQKIIKKLSRFKDVEWRVFSKHAKEAYRKKNVFIAPVNNDAFVKSLSSGSGVLCGAGFETPAEALFLGKKLMVLPMKSQFEQQCNAAALKQMGVPVIKNLKNKRLPKIEKWLNQPQPIHINYPNETESIIDHILQKHLKDY